MEGAGAGGVEAAALAVVQIAVRPDDDDRVEFHALGQVIAGDDVVGALVVQVVRAAVEAVDVFESGREGVGLRLAAGEDGDGGIARGAEALEDFAQQRLGVIGDDGRVSGKCFST